MNTVKQYALTVNSKISNYSTFYQIGKVKIMSVLFTTNSIVAGETLFTLPIDANVVIGALLIANNGGTAQISVSGKNVKLENTVPANVTVGGTLVF